MVGAGVAGPDEVWLGGYNEGVEACIERVMADARCAKDYFTYVARGDGNCGCKGSTDSLALRAPPGGTADYYRIGEPGEFNCDAKMEATQ